jgi:hypothetical protein
VSNLENSEIAHWINLSFVFVPGAISVLQVNTHLVLLCIITVQQYRLEYISGLNASILHLKSVC